VAEGVGGLGGSGGGVVEEVCWGDGGYDFVVPGWEDVCVDFEAELEGEGEDGEEGGFGWCGWGQVMRSWPWKLVPEDRLGRPLLVGWMPWKVAGRLLAFP